MKILPLLVATALAVPCPLVAQQPAGANREQVKLSLAGGGTITGTVSGVMDGNVSVITGYGMIRVPVAKLTDDFRKKLAISADANAARLEKRIAELEARKRQLASAPAAPRARLHRPADPLDRRTLPPPAIAAPPSNAPPAPTTATVACG